MEIARARRARGDLPRAVSLDALEMRERVGAPFHQHQVAGRAILLVRLVERAVNVPGMHQVVERGGLRVSRAGKKQRKQCGRAVQDGALLRDSVPAPRRPVQ